MFDEEQMHMHRNQVSYVFGQALHNDAEADFKYLWVAPWVVVDNMTAYRLCKKKTKYFCQCYQTLPV